MHILITGGAGFVGSNLALYLKQNYKSYEITVLDNLKRRGSELNIPRLKAAGIAFLHGDIRNAEDFEQINGNIDFLVEASAEPSVMAGVGSFQKFRPVIGGYSYLTNFHYSNVLFGFLQLPLQMFLQDG